MTLNDVKIVGNLTRDPETRYTENGTAVANVSLGVNEYYTPVEGGERRQITTFVDVQVWGPSAATLAEFGKKGAELLVEGSLRQDHWQDKQTNQNRSRLYVKAARWQFTQYRPKEPAETTPVAPAPGAEPLEPAKRAKKAAQA